MPRSGSHCRKLALCFRERTEQRPNPLGLERWQGHKEWEMGAVFHVGGPVPAEAERQEALGEVCLSR